MKPVPLHRHANSFNPSLSKKVSTKPSVPGSPSKKLNITSDDLMKIALESVSQGPSEILDVKLENAIMKPITFYKFSS